MTDIKFSTYQNSMLVLSCYDRRSISSIKELIRRLGGSWNASIHRWTFPIKMDTPELRELLQTAYKIEWKKMSPVRMPRRVTNPRIKLPPITLPPITLPPIQSFPFIIPPVEHSAFYTEPLGTASPINFEITKEKKIDLFTHRAFLPIPPIRQVKKPLEVINTAVEEKDDTSWMCCMECTVIDWHKKETYCTKCGIDGYNFRIEGLPFSPLLD